MARGISCAFVVAAFLATASIASAADRIVVATVGNASDAALFIARDRGYFTAEKLDIEYTPIDSLSRMIAPLGQGTLDIGSGTAVAGLYNAVERGIGLRIVADRSRMEKGYRFQSLVVRKALIESGRFKSLADLKGLRFALLSNAGSPASALNEAAKKGGISYNDIEKIILIFPQQIPHSPMARSTRRSWLNRLRLW